MPARCISVSTADSRQPTAESIQLLFTVFISCCKLLLTLLFTSFPSEPAEPWGKGFINDFKRTVGTHWVSEMTNFNQKTVPVALLMFISVIAPTLTFGAVYGRNTENNIGAVETILAVSWIGCCFALFSGMPTVIVGPTGPVLIMSTVMYDMSSNLGIPFLPFYAWVSVWICIYTSLTAFFDLTRYVRLATRFTDDIFAFLIVSIFILNAIGNPFAEGGILRYLDPNNPTHGKLEESNPENDYSYQETALLSILLGLATTATIFFLRGFKTSSYFCNQGVRNSVHDFAVTFAVIAYTLIQQVGFKSIEIQGLNVPSKFQPTFTCCDSSCDTLWPGDCEDQTAPFGTRPWFANLGDLNGKGWVPLMAAGPGILAFVLVYLDNGITWHLIYNPNNNLQHGESYNWDLFVNGVCNMINGMLGLPWLVASTVPCIVHLNNLAEKDSKGNITSVHETRLTGLIAHALVGFSLLALKLIKLIPLPVLLGVFLFMGLSSMPGIQFWNRILMYLMQPNKYPETPFTKYVEKKKIHLFTFLQICFFCGVFFVQNTKSIAIIFPFMTLLCIPGRLFLLPMFFEGWELLLLDGDNEDIERWIALKEGKVLPESDMSADAEDVEEGAAYPMDGRSEFSA